MIRARRGIQVAVAGLVMSGLCLTAAPAFAETTGSDTGVTGAYPDIPDAPAWYAASRPAPYSTDGYQRASDQAVDDSVWFEKVLYFMPNGNAPESTDGSLSPDIRVTTFTTVNLFGDARRVDPEALVLSISEPFQKMSTGIGTTLTTGIVLPADPNSTDVNATAPTVRFLGHGMVQVRRPGFPSSCDAIDPVNFIIQTAMLGENSYKYAVELNVTFGDRKVLRNQVCAGKGKSVSENDRSSKPDPISSQLAKAEESTKSSVKKDLNAAVDKVKPKTKNATELTTVIGWGFAILVLLGVVMLASGKFRSRQAERREKFDNFGHPEGHADRANTREPAAKKTGYGRS